ncbi:MAG: bifunctional oligoribonuclease/PAP phosphatase NrnA [Endomicrobium sp.]|jgi:phosphoesterase RecJ-like protein|nr:bifunctional oligoribonuclease/PAP phosphatase NrnA [Endomicrobium sp.]
MNSNILKLKKNNFYDTKKILNIANIIKQAKTFFLSGHLQPDCDSVGSALALASVLNRINKKAVIYSYDRIPEFLKFLDGVDEIKMLKRKTNKFDCAIILEASNFFRIGNKVSKSQFKKIINIDHHLTFSNFGTVNYVVPSSSSTAELVLNILEYMKIKLTKNEAECLYTGILTDTGCFQQINTNINSHIASIKLMKYGVNINKIYKKIHENNSVNGLKLKGLALCSIKTVFNNRVAYIVLTKKMFKKSHAKYDDCKNIVNYILTIKSVKVGCVFREIDKNITKISLRSIKNFNLLDIVNQFGGGGHKNAAGCIINNNMETSIKIIVNVLKNKIYDKEL